METNICRDDEMSAIKEDDWTTEDWAKKLKQQADESKEYRHRLYEKVDLKNKRRILDVGCGTGAVTMDIALLTKGDVVGVDIDDGKLQKAERLLSDINNTKMMKANVLDLPFENETFDLVMFNIVLMYIKDQQKAVNEMARVTRKNGIVLATLEPDYAGRIDYPENPATLLILKNMEKMGADLYTGRKLKYLFSKAGLKTEFGIDTESDYILLKDDKKRLDMFLNQFWVLEKLFQKDGWTKEQIKKYKTDEIKRIENGLSFSFTPCFYAIGRKI